MVVQALNEAGLAVDLLVVAAQLQVAEAAIAEDSVVVGKVAVVSGCKVKLRGRKDSAEGQRCETAEVQHQEVGRRAVRPALAHIDY